MNYGEKIASLRKQHNMTQSDLGKALNVSFQAVSKWENGMSEPSLDTIKQICELFKVPVGEFLGMNDEQNKVNNAPQTPTPAPATQTVVNPVVIMGYCETCKKPLHNPSEYVVETHRHGRSHHTQHIYCNECKQKKIAAEKAEQLRENQEARRKGFYWGIFGGIVGLVLFVILGITNENIILSIVGGILGAYGGFAFASQVRWENSVLDCLSFFVRSFSLPGLIFELDLDGIIWLLTVKLIGAIVTGLLSIFLFLLGVAISVVYAMFSFPFAVGRQMRGEYD